ncbi:phosphonate C-P lyase system protein PhnG [Polycladidibacter stylochi]|uniref:phosphonate C-P lyase system protein PhnG n=1 Tax=Polycladidibacter stylochi TaxID=1807766 RepID=UPI0008341C53|nr:phosphonate C-P lyase system protein PhnG [Pseudovibrio stylochi]
MNSNRALSPDMQNRRAAMATCAKASKAALQAAVEAASFTVQEHRIVRPPEIGLVMVRGQIGGTGAPFNLCEATLTRCVVALSDGTTGFGQCLGRDKEKALLCALLDAHWQQESHQQEIEEKIMAPLRTQQQQHDAQKQAETKATKVDFFTMVRGE